MWKDPKPNKNLFTSNHTLIISFRRKIMYMQAVMSSSRGETSRIEFSFFVAVVIADPQNVIMGNYPANFCFK